VVQHKHELCQSLNIELSRAVNIRLTFFCNPNTFISKLAENEETDEKVRIQSKLSGRSSQIIQKKGVVDSVSGSISRI
jgi:hypothetical protein